VTVSVRLNGRCQLLVAGAIAAVVLTSISLPSHANAATR
jgi:hypothetical protein